DFFDRYPFYNLGVVYDNLVQTAIELKRAKEIGVKTPMYPRSDPAFTAKNSSMGQNLHLFFGKSVNFDAHVRNYPGQNVWRFNWATLQGRNPELAVVNPMMKIWASQYRAFPVTGTYAISQETWTSEVQRGRRDMLTFYGKAMVRPETVSLIVPPGEDSAGFLVLQRSQSNFRSTQIDWFAFEWGRPSLFGESILSTELRYAYNVTRFMMDRGQFALFENPQLTFDKKLSHLFLWAHYFLAPVSLIFLITFPSFSSWSAFSNLHPFWFFVTFGTILMEAINLGNFLRHWRQTGNFWVASYNMVRDVVYAWPFYVFFLPFFTTGIWNATHNIFSFIATIKQSLLSTMKEQKRINDLMYRFKLFTKDGLPVNRLVGVLGIISVAIGASAMSPLGAILILPPSLLTSIVFLRGVHVYSAFKTSDGRVKGYSFWALFSPVTRPIGKFFGWLGSLIPGRAKQGPELAEEAREAEESEEAPQKEERQGARLAGAALPDINPLAETDYAGPVQGARLSAADLSVSYDSNLRDATEYMDRLFDALIRKYGVPADEAEISDAVINELNGYVATPEKPLEKATPENFKAWLTSRLSQAYIDLVEEDISEGKLVKLMLWGGQATRAAAILGGGAKSLFSLKKFSQLNLNAVPIKDFGSENADQAKALEENEAIKNRLIEFQSQLRAQIERTSNPYTQYLIDLSLGAHEVIQYRTELEGLAAYRGVELKEIDQYVRQNGKLIVSINDQTGTEILKEWLENNFFGFDPENIVFVQANSYPVFVRDLSGKLVQMTREFAREYGMEEPVRHVYGHGLISVDLKTPGTGFVMTSAGEVKRIEVSPYRYMLDRGAEIVTNANIDDNPQLTAQALPIERLAFYQYHHDTDGVKTLFEGVENLTGQKGGALLKGDFTVEGTALKSQATQSFVASSPYLNRMLTIGELAAHTNSTEKAPMHLVKKKIVAPNGKTLIYYYPENYFTDSMTHFVRSKAFYEQNVSINTFKKPLNVAVGIPAKGAQPEIEGTGPMMLRQHKDARFGPVARRIYDANELRVRQAKEQAEQGARLAINPAADTDGLYQKLARHNILRVGRNLSIRDGRTLIQIVPDWADNNARTNLLNLEQRLITSTDNGLEYFKIPTSGNKFSLMKGLIFSQVFNAVSQGNLDEMMIPTASGGRAFDFDGIIRSMAAKGHVRAVFNGTDIETPFKETDSVEDIVRKKAEGKAKLTQRLEAMGAKNIYPDTFFVGLVSRIADQKGLDRLILAMRDISQMSGPVGQKVRVVLLAKASPDDQGGIRMENELKRLATQYPDNLSFINDSSREIAAEIYAGSDAFAMPSKHEPAGIAQQIANKNGAFVIAPETGGLKDFFNIWGGVGYKYSNAEPVEGLKAGIGYASNLYWTNRSEWNALAKKATQYNAAWSSRIDKYLKDVYGDAMRMAGADGTEPRNIAIVAAESGLEGMPAVGGETDYVRDISRLLAKTPLANGAKRGVYVFSVNFSRGEESPGSIQSLMTSEGDLVRDASGQPLSFDITYGTDLDGNPLTLPLQVRRVEKQGVTYFFLEDPDRVLFRRIYKNPDGLRGLVEAVALSQAALVVPKVLKEKLGLDLGIDVFHANDWQAGLVPVYLQNNFKNDFPKAASVFTSHNIAYQGSFNGYLLDRPELLISGARLAKEITSPTWKVHIEPIDFTSDQLDGFQAHSGQVFVAAELAKTNREDMAALIRKISRDPKVRKDFKSEDLNGEMTVSYVAKGSHKFVYKVAVRTKTGDLLPFIMAAKAEISKGDINSREILELQKLQGVNAPYFGTSGKLQDGRLWYTEEFIEGELAQDLVREKRLTTPLRKGILATLLGATVMLGGLAPKDVHGGNFIIQSPEKETQAKAVMIDLGEKRLSLWARKGKFVYPQILTKHRTMFLGIFLAQYGYRPEEGQSNNFIFDTIVETLGYETGLQFLWDVLSGSEEQGVDGLKNMFRKEGRDLFAVLSIGKDIAQQDAHLLQFTEQMVTELRAYLIGKEKFRGPPSQGARLSQSLRDAGYKVYRQSTEDALDALDWPRVEKLQDYL
ncbi:MAG TPA: glycogen/starch synthase, partial [Candidatus Omnitrophota bacterium]|nr:glycogen/starch synthase [Candidatus Omnitrophota bacterium]